MSACRRLAVGGDRFVVNVGGVTSVLTLCGSLPRRFASSNAAFPAGARGLAASLLSE